MKPISRVIFVLAIFSLTAVFASAQEQPGTIQNPNKVEIALNKQVEKPTAENDDSVSPKASSILNRVGTDSAQSLVLSLNDAIKKALENNNNIEIARNDVRYAETQLRSMQGAYDPVFTVSPTYQNNIQPQTTTLGGADLSGVTRSNSLSVNSSFGKMLKEYGGNYSVFFNNNRNGTSSTFSQLNPSYTTNLGVQYTQPLFRNRAIDSTRRQIRIQQRKIEQSDADFRIQTIAVISQVQSAYWDLVFALKDQQNQTANLNLSKENLRRVEAAIAAGKSAPLERAEVATELANRESEVLVAAQQVSIYENTLKTLVLMDPAAPEWGQSIVPTDQPVFSMDPISLTDAMKDAVANRPELKRLRLQSEINSVDIDYYKDQLKPQIDLNTQFTLIGLAGSTTSTSVPSQFVGSYGQSVYNLMKTDTRTFSIGAAISFPLKNQSAKANLAGAEIQKQQIAAQSRLKEQSIIAEVRNAVQAVETARQRVLTARSASENAEIQLNGERKLYEVGRSTSFLLFQRENTLTNARNSVIRAETDYSKALSALQQASSTTFRINNIEIASPK